MSKIYILPLSHSNEYEIDSLIGHLINAHAAGSDLGSRISHMRALGETLLLMRQQLKVQFKAVQDSWRELGVHNLDAEEKIERLLDHMQRLVDITRHLPPGD